MKLAEALIARADSQKRLDQLKARILRAAKVQEGDKPPEDPAALIVEYESTAAELLSLIQRINRTNAQAELGTGKLSDRLAERDVLSLKRKLYHEAADAAVVGQDRYSKSEIRFEATLSVAQMQAEADRLAKQFRELDARIQQANWLIDLVE